VRVFGLGPSGFALLALFVPAATFLGILTLTVDSRRVTAWFSTLAAFVSLVLGSVFLWQQINQPRHIQHEWNLASYVVPSGVSAFNFELKAGVLVDPLAAALVVVVAAVSFLIQWYALAYLRSDTASVRFFAFLSLFTFSMLGLAVSTNYFQFFIFWELLGVCAYVLIGHWWQQPEAAAAARKAFVVTRIGDMGLLLGIAYIYLRFGTLNFQQLASQYGAGKVGVFGLQVIALLVFSGAVAKSAQLPLHVWLPDAGEGPVPLLAFLNGATVVAAGAYLVARVYPLFQAAKGALTIMAFVGVVTALVAALWALAQKDLKRILAYATISHLGLVFVGLGVGAFSAAVFHLFAHAGFKTLLFLAAGSVISMMRTQNIFEMGGLWGRMPVTAAGMVVGALASAGLPPVAGFWSEHAIVAHTAASGNQWLLAGVLLLALLGATYPFRMLFVVFGGEMARRRAFEPRRVREVAATLNYPVVILLGLTVVTGALGIPGTGHEFGDYIFIGKRPVHEALNGTANAAALALGLAGALLASLLWGRRIGVAAVARRAPAAAAVFARGFYVDEAYRLSVRHALIPLGRAVQWVERNAVDAFLELVASAVLAGGRGARRIETGRLSQYALLLFAGVLVAAGLIWVFAGRPALGVTWLPL